ncbi:MAG: diguanylate cyclase [Fimbriimonas sp.]|nr:diguanylate cyclase [Fimbriimonas sp.]
MELSTNEVEKASVRPRVLLVEDDPVSAYLIQQMFHAQNLPLDHATNGAIALDLHRQNRYRLVLSDWMMPEMNGVDLCRAFRRLGGPYVYFILCTSKGQKSDRVEAYDAGVDDFMTKPLDRNELSIRLRVALRILEAEEVVQRQKAELEEMNEKLNHLAVTDALTGLYNRRRFQEMLDEGFAEHMRVGDQLSLVLMDIDRFKNLNDHFGHQAGDAALQRVADILRENSRRHELPARYGGEEFAIILQRCTRSDAHIAAERFRAAIEVADWPDRPITASFGVATCGHNILTLNELISAADQALYMAKQNGRNRVEVFPEFQPVRSVSDNF